MKFGRVMQLILAFYNLSVKHADKVSKYGSAAYGAALYEENGTVNIRTGVAATKTLDGSLKLDTLSLSIK